MARNLPDNGQVVRICEIFQRGSEELDGQAVRVMGKLETHDIVVCTAELSNVERTQNSSPHQQLTVNTRLIEPFQARLGSIFQMIGETEFTTRGPLLHARLVKCVDGIDTAVYYKVLDMQRQYFKQRLVLHV
ncbi:CST complex subunit TEN1-like [Branchiostoma lanceolatum]|uniref:TEN1 protein n=1 Tax=Branchiostoma lanceolatum TaxID=7740 RepID=A0A8K0EP43_BRALA|nr:TEN1 [Branchiostoma lanceolatum]